MLKSRPKTRLQFLLPTESILRRPNNNASAKIWEHAENAPVRFMLYGDDANDAIVVYIYWLQWIANLQEFFG